MPEQEDIALQSLLTDVETLVTLHRSTNLGNARIGYSAEKTLKSVRDRLLGNTYLYPESIKQLVKRMTTFWGWIRAGMVRELAQTGSIHALPYLVIALFWGGRRARMYAVDGMANIGGERVAPSLICALDDSYEKVLRNAQKHLVGIGTEAVPHLIKELEIIWNSRLRQSIIHVLDQIDDSRAILPLTKCFKDINQTTVEIAASSVVRFGPRAVDPLTTMLRDNNRKFRIKVFDTLAQLWEHVPLKTVKHCLEDPEPGVRAGAALLLVKYHDLEKVDTLIEMLNDRDNAVQAAAAEALGECRDPRAVKRLLRTLNDSKQSVRLEAARALGEINHPSAIEPLAEKISGGHFHSMVETVLSLALMGDVRALAPMTSIVSNPSHDTPEMQSALDFLEYRASLASSRQYCKKCFSRTGSHKLDYRRHADTPWWEAPFKYYACRTCHSNSYLYPEVTRVIWVLDKNMIDLTQIEDEVLKVNAIKKEELIDFDEIHIMDADDYQVERMVTRVKNDTDDYRLKRLKKASVFLSPDLSISQSKINLLRESFNVRTMKQEE